MTGFVGRLRARLGLDTAEFDAGMRGAQVRARTGFAGAFASIGRAVLPVTAAIAAAGAATYAVVGPAMHAAAAIDEAAKAARRVDGSLAGWESLRLAAGEAGVDVRALSDQIQNLNVRLAAPTAQTQSALARLGLDASALAQMDVDARVAAIADAVAGLGLDAGQTGAALRDLGIEDRRMVGLIAAGGAGIRAAAQDIADYGLAVSDIDAARIEAANDQIGRLSLVTRYLGQSLATAVVPGLGAMAQALTDSMREGGALRGVIDLLSGGLSRMGGFLGDVVTIGGGFLRWVWDLVDGVRTGDGFLHDMAVTLGNMAREVWGVVRIMSGANLVAWFADLIRGAGGFGEALGLLGDVATGAWRGIVESAQGIPSGLSAIWHSVREDFLWMTRGLVHDWADLLRGMRDSLPEIDLFEGMRGSINDAYEGALYLMTDIGRAAHAARRAADEAGAAWRNATSFSAARVAIEALNAAVARGEVTAEAAAETQRQLNAALAQTGAAGGAAAGGIAQAADAAGQLETRIGKGVDAAADLIESLARGDWKSALAQLLAQIAQAQLRYALLQSAMKSGGKGGGILGLIGALLMPGNARGTQSWRGGVTMVGEEGPELVRLPVGASITPALTSAQMMRDASGAGGDVRVAIRMVDGNLVPVIEQVSGRVAARAVGDYDANIFPQSWRRVAGDPRVF